MKVKRVLLIIGVLVGCAMMVRGTSGIGYQSEADVDFIVNDYLSMILTGEGSSADFVISNLMPGNYAISNTVTINVLTNDPGGYTLSARVGDGITTTTSDLVHATNSSNRFTSLGSTNYSGVSISSSSFPAGGWGYVRTVDNSDPTANGFEGLSYNSDRILNATNDLNGTTADIVKYPGGNIMKITLGAKASSTQVSGEYRNVIMFRLVGNVWDPDAPNVVTLEDAYRLSGKTKYAGYYKLQDMTSGICTAATVVDEQSQMRAIDVRDSKVYWIARLRDGNCWMTQNLDLDLDSNITYTHADTDLGYGSDYTTTWSPSSSTRQLNSDGSTFPAFGTVNEMPRSLNTGDWYYAGSNGMTLLASTNVNYLTSTNRTTTNGVTTVNNGSGVVYYANAPFDINGTHGHVGNYYNWPAAIASNDASSYVGSGYDVVAQNSICPAGWRLPIINDGAANEFENVALVYDGGLSSPLESSPLFFVRGDYVNQSALYSGQAGYYWSSTAGSGNNAYDMYFNVFGWNFYTSGGRSTLRSVRCLAR